MRETWFDPWVGKTPWRRERLPTPVFWPGEFHGLYSPWGHKESDTSEWLSLHVHKRRPTRTCGIAQRIICVCVCVWITVTYTKNWKNIINQLYFNKKEKIILQYILSNDILINKMFNSPLMIKSCSAFMSAANLLFQTYFLSLLITNIPINWLPHLYTHSKMFPTIMPLLGLLLPSDLLVVPFPDHWLDFKSVPSTHFLCSPLVFIFLDYVTMWIFFLHFDHLWVITHGPPVYYGVSWCNQAD